MNLFRLILNRTISHNCVRNKRLENKERERRSFTKDFLIIFNRNSMKLTNRREGKNLKCFSGFTIINKKKWGSNHQQWRIFILFIIHLPYPSHLTQFPIPIPFSSLSNCAHVSILAFS